MAAHGRSQQWKERKAFSQSGSCSRQRSVAGFARDSLRVRACNGIRTCLWTNCRLSASRVSLSDPRDAVLAEYGLTPGYDRPS